MSISASPGSGIKLGAFGRPTTLDPVNDLWGGLVVGYWNGTDFVPVDMATLTGPVIETAPTTDTASSGLNGRLQRIAQRITALITAIGSPLQAGGAVSVSNLPAIQAVTNAAVGATTDASITNPATAGTLVSFFKGAVSLLAQLLTAVGVAVPDRAVTLSLDLNTASATTTTTLIAGMKTLGIALPAGTYGAVTLEAQTTPSDAYEVVSVFARGATGRSFKTMTAAGAYEANVAGLYSARLRTTTVGGAASVVAPNLNLSSAQRIITNTPTNTGQTTRSFNEASSVKVATSGADANSGAIAASEVEIQCVGAALWYNRNAAAVAGSGSRRLAADERTVVQISPGDIIHVIQDSAAGYAVVTPVL